MFFSLSLQQDDRFPCHHQLGRLLLHTDYGWHTRDLSNRTIVFKGYAESGQLADMVCDLQDHTVMGNFCVFDHDHASGTVTMKTSQYRSFTMWTDGKILSNFYQLPTSIWTDRVVSISQDMQIVSELYDAIGSIDPDPLSRDHAIAIIHERIRTRVNQFLQHNRLPLRVFVSGGIDSMLVFSYIKSFTDRFEVIFQDHVEWDEFWCRNQNHIKSRFWAYRQIHHWTDPCVLSSGAPGDEFMLRSPTTANLWLKFHDTSIPDQLEQVDSDRCLHGHYFLAKKNQDVFAAQENEVWNFGENRRDFFWQLCNILINDQQHWHLGNTFTYTPLRDLEIIKTLLRLDLQSGIDQIMNSGISRELITKNDPDLLNYLSDSKNTGEVLSNIPGLMSKYHTFCA